MRVLAVGGNASSASFEQRVLAFVSPLAARGVEVVCAEMPEGAAARRELMESAAKYDLLLLHRVLMPPWRLSAWRRRARRIVFDYDDPIMFSSHGRSLSRRIKFAWTLRRADAAIAGSEYLASFARPYCPQVHVVPMAIDLPPQCDEGVSVAAATILPARGPVSATMLWLGSRSTQRFLFDLLPALAELGRARPGARLRVVGHEPVSVEGLEVDYRKWSPQEQELALAECGIGLCPMPDTTWTRGKCPYKVLQYMAAGMAWVGSAVGENLTSAGKPSEPDPRGLCAATPQEWTLHLTRLLDDATLRTQMGQSGLRYVREHHWRERLADRLAGILREVVDRRQ